MRSVISGITAAGMLVGACALGSGGVSSDRTGDEDRPIDLVMQNFAFTPNVLMLRPGEKVTLRFKNGDPIEHEFMAGREPSPGRGYGQDLFNGVETAPRSTAEHGMGHGGELVALRVAAGQTATMTFVVPSKAGSYEFGCFVEGHYEAGMKGALTILGAVAPQASAGGATTNSGPPGVAPSPHATTGSEMEMEGH